jgi:predicted Zn-ribbon and HTH transcriptional regulator/predicted transcriptional regulator
LFGSSSTVVVLKDWTPKLLTVEDITLTVCSRCGYKWRYEGLRIFAQCPSCHKEIIVLPSVAEKLGLRRLKPKKWITCNICNYEFETTRVKDRVVVCYKCKTNLYPFNDKRRLGDGDVKNLVLKTIQQNPNISTTKLSHMLNHNYDAMKDNLDRLRLNGCVLCKKRKNPRTNDRLNKFINGWFITEKGKTYLQHQSRLNKTRAQ